MNPDLARQLRLRRNKDGSVTLTPQEAAQLLGEPPLAQVLCTLKFGDRMRYGFVSMQLTKGQDGLWLHIDTHRTQAMHHIGPDNIAEIGDFFLKAASSLIEGNPDIEKCLDELEARRNGTWK